MSFFRRLIVFPCILVPLFALGFLIWVDHVRLHRVEAVSALPEWSVASPSDDIAAAADRQRLIVPQHNNESYQWIMQTRLMLERGEWRLRQVDYDNAPDGRITHAPAPYRWWLGMIAWFDRAVSSRPLSSSVEQAALYGDPLLHGLIFVTATVFAAWQFGAFPAVLLSVGLVTLFPLAGGFLPGAPDHHGLAWMCALWSVLLLLAGLGAKPGAVSKSVPSQRRWFFSAGLVGGFGMWTNASGLIPVLSGIGFGALVAAWFARRKSRKEPAGAAPGVPPWRAWGMGGAAMSLTAYAIEYFPEHMGWQLEVNHPLYAFAWLGGAELVGRAAIWLQGEKPVWRRRDVIIVALAVIAVAAVPVALARLGSRGFLALTPLATRLTGLGDLAAPDVGAWIAHDGLTRPVAATCLPALLLVPLAALLLFRRNNVACASVALAFGPVLVALGFAWFQLSWWGMFDGVLLALLVAATAATEVAQSWRNRCLWSGGLVLVVACGVAELWPERSGKVEESLAQMDVEGLVERDLARWLAQRIGSEGAVVFAPPNVTSTLAFYGGLRGLGSFAWENRDGLAAAIRVAGATSPEEAQALIQRRGITYLIIPTWDSLFDEHSPGGSHLAENSFMVALHRWALPPWLRPVPYALPTIAGFENQSVAVFEVVDDQEPAMAFSRLAEYLVETGQMDLALAMRSGLQSFTGDTGALTALALVEAGLGDKGDFSGAFNALLPSLNAETDAALPWDRRVSLAIVLTHGRRFDLARSQVQRCLSGLDEVRVRSLTTASLFRLQMLAKRFGLEIADPKLQRLAFELLPPGTMRERLSP